MLTDKDINKLKVVFPSKKEYQKSFKTVNTRLDRIENAVTMTTQRISNFEIRLDRIEETLQD